ncbi:MAG: hypothetical protein MJ201_04280 [Mycoplasmoidaceae bacterium]|nr:hypothetical protein [Mycoplasmoidaceae bacterium]
MKKRKILLPLLSVGAVASTVGIITSCNKTTLVLNKVKQINDRKYLIHNHVNLKEETIYTIKCDLSKLSENITDFNNQTSLVVSDSIPEKEGDVAVIYNIAEAEVSVDGVDLQQVPEEHTKNIEKNQYALIDTSPIDTSPDVNKARVLVIGGETLNKDSELVIKIQVSTNVNDGYLSFGFLIKCPTRLVLNNIKKYGL